MARKNRWDGGRTYAPKPCFTCGTLVNPRDQTIIVKRGFADKWGAAFGYFCDEECYATWLDCEQEIEREPPIGAAIEEGTVMLSDDADDDADWYYDNDTQDWRRFDRD